ncbi:MAG: CPBP family glutamic-type intramembrane protease [Caldisericia bacterium]|nr:CPBP family glutamic-type intramembrane protease [Caldisericia bacterium]
MKTPHNDVDFNALHDLFSFVLHPTIEKKSLPLSFGRKIEAVFQYMSVNLILQLLLGSAITFFLYYIDSQFGATTTNALTDFVKSSSYLSLLMLGGIVLPFLEEVGFRLPLHFHPLSLGISLAYILVLLYSLVFPQPSSLGTNILVVIAISLLIGGLCALLFYGKRDSIALFWHRQFRWIYYSFAILFGCMHISNFSSPSIWVYLFTPLLILPQFLSGLVLGYVRLQFGFFWGFAFHALWNSALLSLAYVVYTLIPV